MKLKWIGLVPTVSTVVGIIPATTLTSCGNDKVEVIVDTDVGNDCDDIGALTILGNVYRKHKVKVDAVTVCNRSMAAFHTTDIMLERYGIDCPMGQSDNDQPLPFGDDYAQAVDNAYTARSEIDPSRVQSATDVLRRTLSKASARGKKIKLITIGMLNNIDNLLKSSADEISNKTGKELFEENVSEMVLMGGRFDDQMETYVEFNIDQAKEAARHVINETSVPKTFLGWEVGNPVKTGKKFYESTGCPQKLAYSIYNHGELRESWDPMTMYAALIGTWGVLKQGNVFVDPEGHTIFTESPDGICKILPIHNDSEQIAEQLEEWMTVA